MGFFDFLFKKEACPLCSAPMGLFNSQVLQGRASICLQCAKGLRCKFPNEEREKLDEFGETEYNATGSVETYMYDHLSKASLEEVKRVKSELDGYKEKAQAELGDAYPNIFTVFGETFHLSPSAVSVGISRGGELQNKLVVNGLVQSGSFTKGDMAVLVHEGQKMPIRILEVHKKDDSSFETTIGANMSKTAKAGDSAWLILDWRGNVADGDTIAKQ